DQESVEICARNGTTPNGTPVPSHITWIAEGSPTLSIDFPDSGQNCIRGLHCSGNTCEAISNTKAGSTQCSYTVGLNGAMTQDPVVVVDDCCPSTNSLPDTTGT